MSKASCVLVVSVLLGAGLQQSRAADPKTIANFNMPVTNNVGGTYGSFSPKADETAFVTVATWDDQIKRGDEGGSMRLDYNVDMPGAFNGFWMRLGPAEAGNNLDASAFTMLVMWVKGDSKTGTPAKFKVELKGDPGASMGQKNVKGLTDAWLKVEIPLAEFTAQGVDLTKLNEIAVVFENGQVIPGTKGTIWIDDITLE